MITRREFAGLFAGGVMGGRFPRQTPIASPTASELPPAQEHLHDLLRFVPDTPENRELLLKEASWQDYEKQRAALVPEDGTAPTALQATMTLRPLDNAAALVGSNSQEDEEQFHTSLNQLFHMGTTPAKCAVLQGLDNERMKASFESRPYDAIEEFPEFTTFLSEGVDLRGNIHSINKFVVVFKEGPIITFPSREHLLEFGDWWERGGDSLADLDPGTEFGALPQATVSSFWFPIDHLYRGGALHTPTLDESAMEQIEDLAREEAELFGALPMPLRFWIGSDAGTNTGDYQVDTGPWAVNPPFPMPKNRAYLQFDSAESAEAAAPILDWRWKNMPSLVTGNFELDTVFGYESSQTLPEDPTVVVQEFSGERRTTMIYDMVSARDVSVYGFGEF